MDSTEKGGEKWGRTCGKDPPKRDSNPGRPRQALRPLFTEQYAM